MRLHLNYINSNGYAPEFTTLARLGHRLIGTQYKTEYSRVIQSSHLFGQKLHFILTNNQSESLLQQLILIGEALISLFLNRMVFLQTYQRIQQNIVD